MFRYVFFVKKNDVKAVCSEAETTQLLRSGYQKLDFETNATGEKEALKLLQVHLEENTTATKHFTGDITFSSIIESLLR